MKRNFEVSFYEYGLTRKTKRKFFFELSAYLYKGWLEYKWKNFACVEIKELNNE